MKVEVHPKCTVEDEIEAVETNFHGTLDDAKISKGDTIRNFKIKKLE